MQRRHSMKKLTTAACRFCGQLVQMEFEKEITGPQAEETATMKCDCYQAKEYQMQILRKKKAKRNIERLFGENAMGVKINGKTRNLLMVAADEICNENIRKIALDLPGGIKALVSKGKKGEINVERIETRKQKLME